MKDLQSLLEHIRANVSLGDLLVRKDKIRGAVSEEQFGCMFHGADRKKSARYYRETDTAYCWVCKEKWDIISFTQRLESLSFAQTINYLVKSHGLDISKLPEAPDAEVARIKTRKVVKINNRKLVVDKLLQAITAIQNDVAAETYNKFVYTYMMLKYVVPDEKFQETFEKFRDAMLRVLNKQKMEKTSCQA